MPQGEALGNTTRNQFYGPGLFSSDISLARTIPLTGLRDSARLEIRADAFNFLNHANLNNPAALWIRRGRGIRPGALWAGGKRVSFPILTPFTESGRQFQILLRLMF